MSPAPSENKDSLAHSTDAVFELFSQVIAGAKNLWDSAVTYAAAEKYLQKYLRRHDQVKVLGMPEPTPLRDIYTDVEVVSRNYLSQFRSVEDLERTFRGTNREFFATVPEQRLDAISIASSARYLNVLGAPGAGKTTLLRRIGLEALMPRRKWRGMQAFSGADVQWSAYEPECIPVVIELRRFRYEPIAISAILRAEFEECGIEHANDFIFKALTNGQFVILLDGLDEVSSIRLNEVVAHVRDFVDRFPNNRYVTSCRTAFYKSYFQSFRDVVIADFDDKAVRSFIRRWFSRQMDIDENVAEVLWRELVQQRATLELARTPLLLTFLCIVYDQTQSLPTNRTILYRRALEILLERWAAEKRVHNEAIYRDLHPEVEIEMLADLAGTAFEENRLFFEKREIVRQFTAFVDCELNAPRIDAERILEAIEIQQGLLVSRATDVYSFSHLSLQEYLAAHSYRENNRMGEIVARYTFDERWREIFILMSGVERGDVLLRLLAAEVLRFVRSNENLVALFRHATEMERDPAGSMSSLARRLTHVEAALVLDVACTAFHRTLADPDPFERLDAVIDRFERLRVLLRKIDPDASSGIGSVDWDGVVAPALETESRFENANTAFLTYAMERMIAAAHAITAAGVRPQSDRLPEKMRDLRNGIALQVANFESERNRLVAAISAAFGMRSPLLIVTSPTVDSMNSYLHAATVVAEVRRSALRVSPDAWNHSTRAILFSES